MPSLLNLLLGLGLIFPMISLLTGIGSLVTWRLKKKHSSPVFIPFIGPLILSVWLILADMPVWAIPAVWLTDIGTLALLAISPRLMSEWWNTSSFTRILALSGMKDDQSAILSLHSTGHYLLKKCWNRPAAETGISALGEPGTFTQSDDRYELTSHAGRRRVLQKIGPEIYRVTEEELPTEQLELYSLNEWVLRK